MDFKIPYLPPSAELLDMLAEVDAATASYREMMNKQLVDALSHGMSVRLVHPDGTSELIEPKAYWRPRMLEYPDKATPAMLDVLGQMPWTLQPIAHALRADGHDIPRKTEAEQAAAQHWLMLLALEHGDGWKPRAAELLQEMVGRAKAKESTP